MGFKDDLCESFWDAVAIMNVMRVAAWSFLVTIFEIIFVERKPLRLIYLGNIRTQSFSRVWKAIAPAPYHGICLPDASMGEEVNLPSLLSDASGVILEVGPGTGTFTPYFTPSNVTAIYGAEPAKILHRILKKSTKVTHLRKKYHILSCGAQSESLLPALGEAGLLKGDKAEGVFDTIVCLRVLCSVPDLEATLTTFYSLLRPGGRIIIYEHVVNQWMTPKGRFFARAMQTVLELLGWGFFMGDCNLTRDTVGILKRVGAANGGWETIELERTMESSILPWVVGQFVKRP